MMPWKSFTSLVKKEVQLLQWLVRMIVSSKNVQKDIYFSEFMHEKLQKKLLQAGLSEPLNSKKLAEWHNIYCF